MRKEKKIERINDVGVAFAEIETCADDIQSKCTDFIVPNIAANLKMTDEGSLQFLTEEKALTDWSLTQLGTKLRIPASYLRTCMAKGFAPLAAENVNTWLKTKEKASAFIRCYDKNEGGLQTSYVRGFLSNRYTSCDNPDILEMTRNTIPDIDSEWRVKGWFLTEERMHLRMVSGETLDVKEDDLYPCIFIDSSDVGKCALHVQFGIYKRENRNGLMLPRFGVIYHQRHMGIDKAEFFLEFQKAISYMPEMIERAENVIEVAMNKAVNLISPDEVESLMHELRLKAKLDEEDAYDVIELAREEYEPTRWGVANALSRFAQDKSIEKRLEIEKAAGWLL